MTTTESDFDRTPTDEILVLEEIEIPGDEFYVVDARSQIPPRRPPTALIVTQFEGEEISLQQAFELDGWSVSTCSGPAAGSCPLMRGQKCELREAADIAVVYVDPMDLSGRLGVLPRLKCAASSSSPGVVALEARLSPPVYEGRVATVGGARGPAVILEATSALLESRTESRRHQP